MKVNNIKAVAFDLDGTLINTEKLIIASYHAVFNKFRPDYKLTKEEDISFIGPPLKIMFNKYFKEDFDTLLKTYRDFAEKHTTELSGVYPHVNEILTYLKNKGYIVCLVTSRFSSSALDMLRIFSLEKYFDKIVCLDDVKEEKPSPEGINLILNEYSLNPDQLIFIGDTKSDYMAGVNAGVYTGLVSWSKHEENKSLKPDLLIEDYSSLERIF